ncbi:MAG: hypothetical protein FWC69_00925 [Defluviitaleaceae bacterium]|nr:hypothetical protein [Defluviitaleaceae bacterium]
MNKKYFARILIVLCGALMLAGCDAKEDLHEEMRLHLRDVFIVEGEEMISEGFLSSGARYEFRGEFDFHQFRVDYNFYLERPTGDIATVNNYIEAAEIGQLYIFPTLRSDMENIERNWMIVVRHCSDANVWMVKVEFDEGVFSLGEPNIFTISSINRRVIEFSRNAGSVYMISPEYLGFENTLEGR